MQKWIYLRCLAEKWRVGELKTEKNGGFTDQPPRSTATTASTITICHHHLDPQESQPPPSKIKGQKNGEMPKRGRRVMRVVWEERKVQREKRKKQRGKGRSTTVIWERKGKKKNKIVLNIIAYLAYYSKDGTEQHLLCLILPS